MWIRRLLAAVFVIAFSSDLQAVEYPVVGVWANANDPAGIEAVQACASYSKDRKAPRGNLLVFNGSKKTEFNGGYLEEETVNNLTVRKIGVSEYQVTDSYYHDGEGGGRPGLRRRSYKLRLLTPDKIELKEGNYPSQQFIRCPSESHVATSGSPPNSQSSSISASVTNSANKPGYVLVEPGKQFGTIGDWKISTARFGVGCLAVHGYDDTSNVTVGGETPKKLAIVIEAARKLFTSNLDAEPYVDSVELVLGNWRRGELAPYGYRGTPGVVAPFDAALSQAFLEAPSIKLTERGSVKLVVPLKQTKEAMGMLLDCFRKTR
ncbi:hypothetical protein ABIE49_000554 [Bradyrhizobium sp. OAE829]